MVNNKYNSYNFQFNVPSEYLVTPQTDYYIPAFGVMSAEGKVASGVRCSQITSLDLVKVKNWQAVLIDIQSIAFEYFQSVYEENRN